MKGDFSRLTFDRRKYYSAVLLQQGRVQLDSDWNEQQEILDRRLRAALVDTLGRCAVSPLTPDAFRIAATANGLTIGIGRMYVDGLLIENLGTGPREIDPVLDTEIGTLPLPYERQPFLPSPPAIAKPSVLYVDVWFRGVTAVEDPELLDPAVGGADTATRIQVVWQVKALDVAEDVDCSGIRELEAWGRLARAAQPRLSVEAPKGYRGHENRLYRVEIHHVDPGGASTFKWSRENGSVAARVTSIDDDALRIGSPAIGAERLAIGDVIELTSEARELSGTPGELREVTGVEGGPTGVVRVSNPLPATGGAGPEEIERIRRWDAPPSVVTLDRRIDLEDGISLRFTGADDGFRPGDFWTFAARAEDASVERLDGAPPRGVHHHYCPLAFIRSDGSVEDCRPPPRRLG